MKRIFLTVVLIFGVTAYGFPQMGGGMMGGHGHEPVKGQPMEHKGMMEHGQMMDSMTDMMHRMSEMMHNMGEKMGEMPKDMSSYMKKMSEMMEKDMATEKDMKMLHDEMTRIEKDMSGGVEKGK